MHRSAGMTLILTLITVAAGASGGTAGADAGSAAATDLDHVCTTTREISPPPEALQLTDDVSIPPPMHCAWASVGWEYYDNSKCGVEDAGVTLHEDLDVLDVKYCMAPTGSGGGGANGGAGLVIFEQDVGAGAGTCQFGDITELIKWDECTESFDHGDPHMHEPAVDCHTVTSESSNTLWAAVAAEAHDCARAPA